jgi:hypothetical protein
LTSCFNTDNNVNERNQLDIRIARLEERIDSLINSRHINSGGSNNTGSYKQSPEKIVRQTNRCQAITKKGTQCKRTAKGGDYCWQHGG